MMNYKKIILLTILTLFINNLIGQDKYIHYTKPGYELNYNVNNPDKLWKLPNNLREISGLSFSEDNKLACNQDEKGNIYIFNLKKGEVTKKIDIGDDGDFEGIEIIGNNAWLVKSNGTLFRVKGYLGNNPKVKEYNTKLKKKNDVEGLGYDPMYNRLLIACKGHPYLEEKSGKEFKAIYSFDLETKELNLKPVLLVTMDSIKFYKDYNTMASLGMELLAYFDDAKGDLSFQPSGIAVHPITGNIYMVGSVGNLMLVLSREGDVLAMVDLRSRFHPQPEGICFSKDGTLYISNEGDDEKGSIMRFKPISKPISND